MTQTSAALTRPARRATAAERRVPRIRGGRLTPNPQWHRLRRWSLASRGERPRPDSLARPFRPPWDGSDAFYPRAMPGL